MKNPWLSFCALVPIAALIFLDQSVLPVALPTLQEEFNATSTALQWCVNAYLLAIAIFVLVSGKIGDRIGHRNALFWGLSGFAVSSIFCGLSPNVETLILARGFQGIGAALMFPAQTAIIASIFPQKRRGKATGMIVSLGSLFLILGPLIGGYLTEAISWRWIFWINLPVAAFGLSMILAFLPKSESQPKKIDVLGFLFFACGVAALTIFFMQSPEWGWSSFQSLFCLGAIPLAFGLLFWREKKISHPFLDLTLFKRPLYAAINVSVSITSFLMMITVYQAIYFQEVLMLSPLETGLITCISAAPTCFMAPIAGKISDRFGPKLPVALGFLCLVFFFFWLGFFSTPSLPSLFAALLAFGMGIPLIFTPSFSSAISSVPPTKTGVAIGMIYTLRMVANTMGIALIHLFVSSVRESFTPSRGARDAEILSFSSVHFVLGFLVILAFTITFLLHNRKSSHQLPNSPAEGWD